MRLRATNVYSIDTSATRESTRLLPLRDVYNCTELPDLGESDALGELIEQHEITDVIDMTNTSCKPKPAEGAEDESPDPIKKLA